MSSYLVPYQNHRDLLRFYGHLVPHQHLQDLLRFYGNLFPHQHHRDLLWTPRHPVLLVLEHRGLSGGRTNSFPQHLSSHRPSQLDDPEIAASLEADAEEDAYRTAGLQQPKPVSQPERKRKAKSSGGQAGARTGRRTRSLERSGVVSEDESEIDFNENQEVTMENGQRPVEGGSVDVLRLVRRPVSVLQQVAWKLEYKNVWFSLIFRHLLSVYLEEMDTC